MNLKKYLLAFSCFMLLYSCSSDDAGDLNLSQNECKISKGISPNPNPDGLNDNFDLSCLADRTGIALLEISDRNGRDIYSQTDYRDEFTGKSDSGDDLVTGHYFYTITFEGEDPEYGTSQKGSLYINVEQ